MTQIKLRRDTSANFTSKNPVLGVGEPAYETDTKKLKIGDGTTAYTQLEYFSAGGGGSADIGAALPLKIVDGVISLEVDGQTIQVVDGKLHASDNIFDIGKFTVVGSPTITDDGIASGFSTGNYIKIPYDWAKNVTNFKITGKFKVENSVQDTNYILSYVTDGYSMGLSFNSTDINWYAMKTSSEKVNLYQRYSIIPNIDYSYELQLNNNLYTFRLFDDTGSAVVNLSESTNSPFSITSNYLRLGVSGNYNPLNAIAGSIDLKSISITVGGKEIFNGLMSSTKPIYDKITSTNTALTTFQTDTDNNFSAVNSALNEKANLSDLALKQNKLTAGDNITISADNVISSTGGSAPSNMVTTDTAQDIAGKKSFTTGKITFKNTDTIRKVLGEINGRGYYCNYYTDKASGEKPCYLGKVTQNVFNMGIPGLKGVNGRIFANTLTKWDGNNEVGTILSTDNLGSYVDGTTVTYTNNKLSATGSASMPSSKYTDLTFGKNGSTYTAPADGLFSVYSGNIFNYQLFNVTKSYGLTSYGKNGLSGSCCLIVSKGDVVRLTYDNTSPGVTLKFIYTEGSKED